MKRYRTLHPICFFPVLLGTLIAFPLWADQPGKVVNLVANGGFEEKDGNGIPVGWDNFRPHYAELVDDGNGNRILQVISSRMTGQPMVSQRIGIPEGLDRVWLVARMRAVNITIGDKPYMTPRIQVGQYGAAGEVLGWGRSPILKEDSDWTDFGYWLDLKEGAVELSIGAGFNSSSGLAEFDNIQLWTGKPTPGQIAEADKPIKGAGPDAGSSDTIGDGKDLLNLVGNGDFETLTEGGQLAHWERSDRAYAEIVVEGDNRFLRISQDGSHRSPFVTQVAEIPEGLLPAGATRLWVSALMRGRNIAIGEKPYENPRVQISFQDEEGNHLRHGWSPRLINNSTEWTTVANWCEVKPGARFVSLGVGFNNSTGVVDFDDLSITRSQPPEARARAARLPDEPDWAHGIDRVIHVDPSHLAASDEGEGLKSQPFATLAAAVAVADESKLNHVGTRLVIAPGEYREPIRLKPMQKGTDTEAPLIIEAAEPGSVTLYGSDRWVDGWTEVADEPGIYQHSWEHDWGLSGNPWEDWANERGSFEVPVPDIAQRWEGVFVKGAPLRQYLDISELTDGSFYVDESGDRLLVDFPGKMTPEEARAEVALRDRLIVIKGRTNVTVRGLTLKHAATGLKRITALMEDGIGYTLEDFVSTLHGGGGFSMNAVDHATWRNVKLNWNGIGGGGFSSCRNVKVHGLEISFNNWRGDWGDWATWHPCGMKNMANDGVHMRDVVAEGNHSHGLWLDWQNENFLVENLRSFDNAGYGLYNEANPGPITVRDSILVNNRNGIHHANSIGLTLEDSIVMNNREGAISLRERIGRYSVSRFTGEKTILAIADWTLRNNIIVQENGGFLVQTPGYRNHWETLSTEKNLWFTSTLGKAFLVKSLAYDFADWQLLTGTALSDYFANPVMTGNPVDGYTHTEGSPLNLRDSWPVLEVKNPGIEALANRLQSRVESTWADPYALVEGVAPEKFGFIDLGSVANRGVRTEDGWIGNPLNQLASGQFSLHGIPFDLLDEADNRGKAGILLPSKRIAKIGGEPLPGVVEVKFDGQAEAVYVLHVAASAPSFERAATYTFVYEDGSEHSLGIDVLGRDIDDLEEESVGPVIARAELQDWWPTHRQFSHERSRRAMVTPEVDPMSAARFVYTTEIRNPYPGRPIRSLRLESTGESEAAIMVLAVTALRN